jgi:ABC-type Fe3+ transport system permease subunit
MTASRTPRRCASIVWLQSFGTQTVYDVTLNVQIVVINTLCLQETRMSQRPASGDQSNQPGASYPGAPRWVKVSVGIVLLLVVVIVLLTALGLHTPGGPSGHSF